MNASYHKITEILYLFAINKKDIATECENNRVVSYGKYIAYKYIIQPKDILTQGFSLDQFLSEEIDINRQLGNIYICCYKKKIILD